MLHAGLDLSRKKIDVCLLSSNGTRHAAQVPGEESPGVPQLPQHGFC
jgi:hypothetical protein